MILLLVVLIACLSGGALAAEVVAFSERAEVAGGPVTVGDVAVIDGDDAELMARIVAAPLGRAPAPGRERELTAAALAQLVHRIAPEALVDAPERVRLVRASRRIEPDWVRTRLEQAVRLRMPWPGDSVELGSWELPERFEVGQSARRLLVHFRDDEDFVGRVRADLEFVDPARPAAQRIRRSAGLEIRVQLPVVVARRDLRRGDTLDESSMGLELRELSRLPRGTTREVGELLGQRLARAVDKGQVIAFDALAAEPIVRRGQAVIVEAGDAGLDVRIEARALERGARGQLIQLENPVTRRRFHAELTGPGAARLPLPGVGARP
jgi:flagella basal body P-ring formation protein FlgA